MTFDDLLNDVARLVGMELNQTDSIFGPIVLVEINREAGRYSVKLNSGRQLSRRIIELEKIWLKLNEFGYADVASVIGDGKGLEYPWSILANLPYIRFFQYQRKQYLVYSPDEVKAAGTTQEVSDKQAKALRSCIQERDKFNVSDIYVEVKQAHDELGEAFEILVRKYPGEMSDIGVTKVIDNIGKLSQALSSSLFIKPKFVASSLKNTITENIAKKSFNGEDEVVPLSLGVDSPYGKGDGSTLMIRQNVSTFSLIYDRIEHAEINLQPDFQRKGRIWKLKDKSLLIESILLGLPLPLFYFAEKPDRSWLIVDGLQRITTIYDFMQGRFPLRDMQFFDGKVREENLNGLRYEDLPRRFQREIREYQIQSHLISVFNDDLKMVRELFHRINTYGEALSNQEIRSALYPGSATKFSRYLAEDRPFLTLTFGKINSNRMRDIEMVLLILSFSTMGYKSYNYIREDDFIVTGMKFLNNFDFKLKGGFDNSLEDASGDSKLPEWDGGKCHNVFYKLKDQFEKAACLSQSIFSTKRFQKIDSDLINKQLFVLITSVFMMISDDVVDALLKNKELFLNEFNDVLDGNKNSPIQWESNVFNEDERDFEYAISQSTGKRVTVIYRFDTFIWLIKKITGKQFEVKGCLEEEFLEFKENEKGNIDGNR